MGSTRSGGGERRALLLNGVLSLGYAVWSVAIAAGGRPVIGALAAVVWLQSGLVLLRIAPFVGGTVVDPELEARVRGVLGELCGRRGLPVPDVVLRDDAIRPAMVRRRRGRTELVLSCQVAARLGEAELRAILAHEVAHTMHDDIAVAQRRGARIRALTLIVGFSAAVVLELAHQTDFFATIPVAGAAAVVFCVVVSRAIGRRNRALETRADREGAVLCGDAQTMMRALTEVHALGDEVRSRIMGTPPLCWLIKPLSGRPVTHPAIEERLAALRVS